LPRRASALRRQRAREVQEVVGRLFFSPASRRAARRGRHLLRWPERGWLRALSCADPKRRRAFSRGLYADPRTAQGHAGWRARARLPGLPPRPLRRVQPGLGPRHAVRIAIQWPRRGDPDVATADREVALRLEAGKRDAR